MYFMLILMTIIESNGSDKTSIFVCQQHNPSKTEKRKKRTLWEDGEYKRMREKNVDRTFSWDFNTVIKIRNAKECTVRGAQHKTSVLIRHLRKCDEKDVKIFAHKLYANVLFNRIIFRT